MNSRISTFLEGIVSRVEMGSQVQYSPGTTLDRPNVNPEDWSSGEAATADANIVVLGLTRHLEGEEGESISSPYFGDRLDYNLPENQLEYLRKIKGDHGKPVIVILTGGCPMNLAEVHELADALLLAWYPGEEGGNAAADILFGNVSPSGRLPITFPMSLDQLPSYDDYSMKGRTYRYMTAKPMYPFGFGLSYASFKYSEIRLSEKTIGKGQMVELSCTIENTSGIAADENVQLYVQPQTANREMPLFSLKGVQRLHLEPGESKTVLFSVPAEMLESINENGNKVLLPGEYILYVGGTLPTGRSLELGAGKPLNSIITVK